MIWQTKKLGEVVKLDLNNQKSLMHFLQQPTLKISEFLTGLFASDKKDLKLSAGHLIQAVIRGRLLTQFGNEIKKYREDGKIKEDFLETDINRASFKEFLEFIDSDSPDEIRFNAMKSIFFMSMNENGDEALAYELMKICRKLSSMEIQILKANFNIVISKAEPTNQGIEWGTNTWIKYWATTIAEQVGHSISEIVLQYENHLAELKLISDKHYPLNNTQIAESFEKTNYFRLTALGYKLCEFITQYE